MKLTKICLKCFVNDSEMLFNVFEMDFNDLSRCSKNFERATYKGGRALQRPALLCRSALSQIVQTAA